MGCRFNNLLKYHDHDEWYTDNVDGRLCITISGGFAIMFILSTLVKTGDVIDRNLAFGICILFSIAGLIFLILAILSWRDYFSKKNH